MLENFEVTRLEKLYIKRRNKIFAKFAGGGILVLAVFAFILYLALKTDEPKTAQNSQNSTIAIKSDENSTLMAATKIEKKNEEPKAPQIDEEQLMADLKSQIKEELKEEQKIEELKEKTRLKYELEKAKKYRQDIEPEIDMAPYFEPEIAYEEAPRKRVVQNVITTEPQTRIPPKKSKGVAQISSTPAAPSLSNLEANYEHTKDPKDALALAQKYYEQRDYKNAAKWAFELNGIDKNDPNGWIIFAKAKYKSGNKNDAIKVLEVYKDRASNASEITSLISKMQSGANIE